MSFRIEEPRILTATDMFMWWCKEKIRKRRHLRIKYATSHAMETILVSRNGDELDWLRKHILVLDDQIARLELSEKDKVYMTKSYEKIFEMKRELMESRERIKHLEKVSSDTEQVIMSEKKFRNVIGEFNMRARDEIIKGNIVNMKAYLGYLYIEKIPRNHPKFRTKGNKTVNWAASRKYKSDLELQGIETKDKDHPDGKNWIVYYTDPWFLKFHWTKKKGACRVKNHGFYAFHPARGSNGATKALGQANEKNKLLHTKYLKRKIYYPSLKKKEKLVA